MDKLIGKRLDGRYEFTELIGIGGMANVYKAFDNVKKCDVAVKVLKDEFLGNEEFVRRFRNESKAIASLSHPNIVRIFDVNFGDRIQYIVMEYIDGVTLKEFIDKAKVLDWKDTVHFTFQILRALQHAHDKGIVHRDIKPQNVMLLQDGTIKIMDFGIARFARDERINRDKAIGSVHYISPEQASGGITDAKSDIYSMGIIMYEMLTGKLPFDGDTPELIATKQIQSLAESPLKINPDIPKGLVDIIVRAMQKDPNKRYQSAAEMLRDIDEFKKNPDILFEYKYFNDEGNTKYFSVAEKEEMKKLLEKGQKTSKNANKKKSKLIPILIGVASAFVLASIIIISIFVFGNSGGSNNDIELPDFVGVKYEDIKTMDDGKYAKLGFSVTEEPNSQYEKGVVFAQYPNPGMKVKDDYQDIKLKVSSGPELATVPNVYNMSLASAQAKLSSAGFTNIVTVEKDDKNVTADYVISTDPKSGEQVSKDTQITIYYSSGKGKTQKVPNVVGQSLEQGRSALNSAGFDVSVSEQDDSKPAGTILSQDIMGEAEVGTIIKLVVSSGRPAERSANLTIPLNSSQPIDDTFRVTVLNSSNKILAEGNYKTGGSISFSDSGSSTMVYTIKITNATTGRSAVYGTVTVNYGSDPAGISQNLNSAAFASTL